MGFANYNTSISPTNQPQETKSYLPSANTSSSLRSDNRSRHYISTTHYPRNISGITDKTQPMSTYHSEGGTFEETLDEHVPELTSQREHSLDILFQKDTSRHCTKPPYGISPRCPCVGHEKPNECDCPCWCPCTCESDLRIGHYCEMCDPHRNIYIHRLSKGKTENPTMPIYNTTSQPDIPLPPHTHRDDIIFDSFVALQGTSNLLVAPSTIDTSETTTKSSKKS
jgi:hypothetical protein